MMKIEADKQIPQSKLICSVIQIRNFFMASVGNIESDYTPKDFLEKLLGKSFNPQPVIEDALKPKNENSNSQSTIQETLPAKVLGLKSPQGERVHFQSVGNIPRIEFRQNSLVRKEFFRGGCEYKENLGNNSLRKQPIEALSAKEIKYDSKNHSPIQDTVSILSLSQKVVPFTTQIPQKHGFIETEQELMMKKTSLILKSLLRGKLSHKEIEAIVSGVQNGMTDGSQFDKLVSTSTIEGPEEQQKTQKQEFFIGKIEKKRSISTNSGQKTNLSPRKVRSCEKYKEVQMSATEMKKKSLEARQELLKSVKKMKQLVFLNQKSLKRTRRV